MNSFAEITRRQDSLEVPDDLYRYAQTRKALSRDDEARFRRYGIYTQRPAEDGFFMVRVRLPGGKLTGGQLRLLAELAQSYGRGLADITVRQNLQYHWVRIENLPDIFERLRQAGLSTLEGASAGVRNILGCPASGVDAEELYDTTPLIRAVNDYFEGSREFADLPRKFKIAISGCARRCVYPEINDIGIFAVRDDEQSGVAFRARVGGGLSTTPRFSQDLGVLVAPEEVLKLCAAIATVFRKQYRVAKGRKAGASFTLEQEQVPHFREAVEREFGQRLRRAARLDAEPVMAGDRSHTGIHRQRHAGLCYVGLSLPGGRTSGAQLNLIADLAERYGKGRIRTTNTQNLLLLDIPEIRVAALAEELARNHLEYQPGWARRGMLACTGTQFCKLALTETKNRARELGNDLEKTVDLDEAVRISVTGCPNACGQHAICDVGLEGSLVTLNGEKREAFQVFLGGGVGARETLGRRIGGRIPSQEVGQRLAQLFARYKQERISNGESFQQFCLRHSDEQLAEYLSAELPQAAST